MADDLEDKFMPQTPQGPGGGAFSRLINTQLNVPRPSLGEEFGAIPGVGMPSGPAPNPTTAAQPNQSLLSMVAPSLAPGHTPWTPPAPVAPAPTSPIAPNMGTFVSPTTVNDKVKQAHQDFQEQFAGPYQSAREEGLVRGKSELMGPGVEGKQRGGLELPDTKWFDEHAVDGGIWIDKEGKHHAMFFPRSEPGGVKSITDQMQPLIDKFVGQVTSQAGGISPNQMNAAASMTSATTQAGLAPSEAALRGAQAEHLRTPTIHSIPMGEGQTATIQQLPGGEIKEITRGAPLLTPEAHAGIASMFNETERDIYKEASDARLSGKTEQEISAMVNARRQQLQSNIAQYTKILHKATSERKQVFTYSQWASTRRTQGLPVTPEAAAQARMEVEKAGHVWANF